jgi:hypothetical protein
VGRLPSSVGLSLEDVEVFGGGFCFLTCDLVLQSDFCESPSKGQFAVDLYILVAAFQSSRILVEDGLVVRLDLRGVGLRLATWCHEKAFVGEMLRYACGIPFVEGLCAGGADTSNHLRLADVEGPVLRAPDRSHEPHDALHRRRHPVGKDRQHEEQCVTKTNRYEPTLTELVMQWSCHYSILMAPPVPPPLVERYRDLVDRLPELAHELSGAHMTCRVLWELYWKEFPDCYAYAQFCENLRRHLLTKKAVMHLQYRPAEKTFFDYAGDKMY